MGSGASREINLQPCPNFFNFMPNDAIIPHDTLHLISKSGELIKSATGAIVIPLRPANEALENMNIASCERKQTNKKEAKLLEQQREVSSSFLVMYDITTDGALAPSAAIAPVTNNTNVAVGKGFNFGFVMPKPENNNNNNSTTNTTTNAKKNPPANAPGGKTVIASTAKTTTVNGDLTAVKLPDDESSLGSRFSSSSSLKSALVTTSSFRGKDSTNSVTRTRNKRLTKINVGHRTIYNIFNDSASHEAWVTFTYYYSGTKEDTKLRCTSTEHREKVADTSKVVNTNRVYVEINKDLPLSILRKKINGCESLKAEKKELFNNLPDNKGKIIQLKLILVPGAAVSVVESSEIQAYCIETMLSLFDPKTSMAVNGCYHSTNEISSVASRLKSESAKSKKSKNKVVEYTLSYVSDALEIDEALPSPFTGGDEVLAPLRNTRMAAGGGGASKPNSNNASTNRPKPNFNSTAHNNHGNTTTNSGGGILHVAGVTVVDSPTSNNASNVNKTSKTPTTIGAEDNEDGDSNGSRRSPGSGSGSGRHSTNTSAVKLPPVTAATKTGNNNKSSNNNNNSNRPHSIANRTAEIQKRLGTSEPAAPTPKPSPPVSAKTSPPPPQEGAKRAASQPKVAAAAAGVTSPYSANGRRASVGNNASPRRSVDTSGAIASPSLRMNKRNSSAAANTAAAAAAASEANEDGARKGHHRTSNRRGRLETDSIESSLNDSKSGFNHSGNAKGGGDIGSKKVDPDGFGGPNDLSVISI